MEMGIIIQLLKIIYTFKRVLDKLKFGKIKNIYMKKKGKKIMTKDKGSSTQIKHIQFKKKLISLKIPKQIVE